MCFLLLLSDEARLAGGHSMWPHCGAERVAMNATEVNHRTTTPDDARAGTRKGVELRQSVRRLVAGQGVQ